MSKTIQSGEFIDNTIGILKKVALTKFAAPLVINALSQLATKETLCVIEIFEKKKKRKFRSIIVAATKTVEDKIKIYGSSRALSLLAKNPFKTNQ